MSAINISTSVNSTKCIAFNLSEQKFCIDILCVKEIRSWTSPTQIPKAPTYVLGAINLRGIVIPIIDFAQRIGLSKLEARENSVVIILETGKRVFGILVNSVSDILSIDLSQAQNPIDLDVEGAEQILHGLIVLGEEMVRVVKPEAIFPIELNLAA